MGGCSYCDALDILLVINWLKFYTYYRGRIMRADYIFRYQLMSKIADVRKNKMKSDYPILNQFYVSIAFNANFYFM